MVVAVAAIAQEPTEQPDTAPAPEGEVNPVVMTVNGDPIYAADISLVMQRLSAQMQRQGGEVDQQELVQAAQRQVVDMKLLAQEARERGLRVPEERVETIMAQVQQQAGGAEQLQQALEQGGMTLERFKQTIIESELAQTMVNEEIGAGVEVSDAEVTEFYESNTEQFANPEQVKARHILIKSPADATEEETATAREKAEAVRQRAIDGEDFATLAEEESEGPSAARGGDLGFFSKERMVPAFAEAAFAMEPGDISEIVTTRFGFHVIKVEDRRDPSTSPLSEVKPQITQVLQQQKTGEAVNELLSELRQEATITIEGMEAEAQGDGAQSSESSTSGSSQ
jgi:peptidyl-prolyl cis-trans isomerase C